MATPLSDLPPGVTPVTNIKGDKGDKGSTGSLAFATAETVPADQPASVAMVGPESNRGAHFRNPRGLPGVNGVENDDAVSVYVRAKDTKTGQAVATRLDDYRREVPAYVTAAGLALNREYDPYLRLFNESSADLARMRRDIGAASIGSVATHILCIGDSKTFGRGAGFADSVPSHLRDHLGALDGMNYAHAAVAIDPDTRWTVTGFTATGTTMHLNAAANAASTAEFQFNRRSTGVRVYYYNAGAASTGTISVDGGTGIPLTSPTGVAKAELASVGWYYIDVTGLANTIHNVKVTVTTAGGAFYLLGVEALHAALGVTISNAGLSGSNVAGWMPGSTSILSVYNQTAGLVAASSVRKVAIVQLGTNTSADEVANLRTLVTRLRTDGFSVLLVVPGGTTTAPGDRTTLKRGLYSIAEDLSMSLVDFTDLIGNTVADARGYMFDTLHENARGYRLEASALRKVIQVAGGQGQQGSATGDTGWILIPSLVGEFTPASPAPAYRIIAGVVHLSGGLYRATAPTNAGAFVLPANARPRDRVVQHREPAWGFKCDIASTGAVIITATVARTSSQGYTLDGISFPAA